MRKNVMLIALAAIGLASCKGGFKQAEGGLLYDINVDKPGETIKTGDFMSLNLVLKTDGDSVIYSTYEQGRPVINAMPKAQQKGDIISGFALLSEGDSATFKMNIDSVFKKGQPKPPGIKGKYLIYNVKVEKVIPRGNLSEVVFQGRISEYMKAQADAVAKAEPAKLKKYADDNKLKTTTTASGLVYEISAPGSGANIAIGDTAVVNYTGKLINGKIFDSSIKEDAEKAAKANKQPIDPRRPFSPLRIAVGQGKVIKGWDEGLLLLKKGSKATFVIPSTLGWGEQGAPPMIPPFAITIFTVEVMDIVHPNPNAPKVEAPQPPTSR
ncbi:FKBP-type peptidyl-prolyl cis-trans isomerase [Mucilaginibacter psychrotolerans]|uniref:peptidylprolyl isomerase n=1 Tax=Mucilaginibacter psychrotolerans TaxID=1524096 RepID=A0A4Y8SB66_9SPHI|nr:FKBP-type peptidyl-prolyl cis-trans isomerase [Mucilaginibacter psychrotolerans]TFF35807.1 FKBP-type peptidylprolyl isomerase [Mucilaginibacter psychrotolerans]